MHQYTHLAGRSYALVTFAIPVRHPPCQETKIYQLSLLLTFLISSKVFHQSENLHLRERGGGEPCFTQNNAGKSMVLTIFFG